MTQKRTMTRRGFFAASSAAALTVTTAQRARADGHGDAHIYTVVQGDAAWRAQLTEFEYAILREGRTEKQRTSPLWEETRPGNYHCKGCDLHSYSGNWKVNLSKGWVFFKHAQPDAVLFGIDGPVAEYGQMSSGIEAVSEVHCRRCASHLGHHLYVEGHVVHCINGTALNFKPQ